MKKTVKIILSILAFVLAAVLIFLTIFFIVPSVKQKSNRKSLTVRPASELPDNGDYIHFLSTGSSDAILLESQGHFALVDSGEDSDNPRNLSNLEYEGFEDKVLTYLKEHAKGDDGKVHLDFVIGTHSHSDHLGGFDTVIADTDIAIDKAYLKQYDSSHIRDKEIKEWDNQEVYDQMKDALSKRNIPIVSKLDSAPFILGNFTITLFNTDDCFPEDKKVGENDQSISTLIEKNGTKVFLSADLDNLTGDEDRYAPQIGDIDLLKVGHHSYPHSTTSGWLKTLKPEVCVVTNKASSVNPNTICRITRTVNSPILITGQENGVIAQIGDGGKIQYFNNIH